MNKFTTLELMQTGVSMLPHRALEYPRGSTPRRDLQNHARMFETFRYSDDNSRGFIVECHPNIWRKSRIRFAEWIMSKCEDMTISSWEFETVDDIDYLRFNGIPMPEDKTVWVKGDQSWMMPQKHPMFR